jgi:hypothetical protein
MLYSCFIFNRDGNCVFQQDWNTGLDSRIKKGSEEKIREQAKLMFGFLYSMKKFVTGISPKQDNHFQSFKTNKYKLHFFESPTGVKFVLLTDPNTGNIQQQLSEIYQGTYVNLVSCNPMHKSGDQIDNSLFRKTLDKYVKQLPFFK